MKFKQIIAKSFNEPTKKISENLKLSKFNWDSMAKINLITIIDKKYNKTLDFRKFEKIKTFKDLDLSLIHI